VALGRHGRLRGIRPGRPLRREHGRGGVPSQRARDTSSQGQRRSANGDMNIGEHHQRGGEPRPPSPCLGQGGLGRRAQKQGRPAGGTRERIRLAKICAALHGVQGGRGRAASRGLGRLRKFALRRGIGGRVYSVHYAIQPHRQAKQRAGHEGAGGTGYTRGWEGVCSGRAKRLAGEAWALLGVAAFDQRA